MPMKTTNQGTPATGRKTTSKTAPAKKPAAQKPAAQKPAAKKPAAKKPAAKQPPAKKPAAKKPAAKKPAAKKPAAPRSPKGARFDLAARLARLPADAARTEPGIPVKTVMLEIERMLRPAQALRPRLARLYGFDLADVDDLPHLVRALGGAEDRWKKERAARAAVSLTRARRDGEALRRMIVKGGRYLLRHDAAAQATLDLIEEGEGLADLIDDLEKLGGFVDDHAPVFAADEKLPDDAADNARALAQVLKGGADDAAAIEALAERNRVYWAVDGAVTEVRKAAAYLLDDDPKRLAPFLSRYEADRKRRARVQRDKKPARGANPGDADKVGGAGGDKGKGDKDA